MNAFIGALFVSLALISCQGQQSHLASTSVQAQEVHDPSLVNDEQEFFNTQGTIDKGHLTNIGIADALFKVGPNGVISGISLVEVVDLFGTPDTRDNLEGYWHLEYHNKFMEAKYVAIVFNKRNFVSGVNITDMNNKYLSMVYASPK